MPTYRVTYYPWITQHKDGHTVRRHVEMFARLVEAEMKKSDASAALSVLPVLEVPAQVESIVQGNSDIALMNPIGFVFARQMNAEIEALAVAVREIDGKLGVSYYGQIYGSPKTALRKAQFDKLFSGGATPADKARLATALKRMTIAFGTPTSTSNFLVPAAALHRAGLHPLTSFSRVEFVGGHEFAAIAVYEGKADLGVGHDGAIVDLANQYGYGDASNRLVQLWRSAPIPSDPVAVRVKDVGQRILIQNALIAAGKTSEGSEALKEFWGMVPSLEQTSSESYDVLKESVSTLALRQQDMLK